MVNSGMKILNAGSKMLAVALEANKHMFYGYPYGAAMDHKSVASINTILGKQINSKVLECSLKACTLKANEDVSFCVGGADMGWQVDGETISQYQKKELKSGQTLSGGFSKNGLRSYIAFSKDIEQIDGQHISLVDCHLKLNQEAPAYQFTINNNLVIRRGPEWNLLNQESKETMIFYSARITPYLSRMGVYLDGKELNIKTEFPKQSVCTFPGVIQLLPSGQLLVLGQDAQTTGGYPRVAYLDRENLADFNQLGIGQELSWSLLLD